MAFWGVEIKSGKVHELDIGEGFHRIEITQAVLSGDAQGPVYVYIIQGGEKHILATLDFEVGPVATFDVVQYTRFKVSHSSSEQSVWLYGTREIQPEPQKKKKEDGEIPQTKKTENKKEEIIEIPQTEKTAKKKEESTVIVQTGKAEKKEESIVIAQTEKAEKKDESYANGCGHICELCKGKVKPKEDKNKGGGRNRLTTLLSIATVVVAIRFYRRL